MKKWLALILLLASVAWAEAQLLHGVTDKGTSGGTPTAGGAGSFPSMLDMPSPFVGGLN